MFIDSLLRVAVAQAFGAAGVSASSIDLGAPQGLGSPPVRQIGTGETMGFGIAVTTPGTVAATLIEIISATDAALTAGIVSEASITPALALTVLGALFFVPLPPGKPSNRFLGVRLTTAGGTISVTAWLTSYKLFSLLPATYGETYTV